MQNTDGNKAKIRNPPLKALRKFQRKETSSSVKVLRAVILVLLAPCFSAAVQLNLIPVYGGVGASLYHSEVITICAIASILLLSPSKLKININTGLKWLPLHTLAVPTILHSPLFHWSYWLGPTYGPALTKLLTSSIPVVFSLFAILEFSPAVSSLGTKVYYVIAMFATGVIYKVLEQFVLNNVPMLFRFSYLMTRATLLLYISCIYSLCFPSVLLLGAVPSVIYVSLFNPHMPWEITTRRLDQTLHKGSFSLLERKESVTGYVSVLENRRDGFRVLRCDHSLLGGEWLVTPERAQDGIVVPETIYSAFTMLEAVRLMRFEKEAGQNEQKAETMSALVIGLGIGTSPRALVAHDVQTTVIELDPAVIEFSRKYFDLPQNVTTINQDAILFVKSARSTGSKYNFVIHDVFTGGAEPAALFTIEFFQSLRDMMKPYGTIAINYTGDLNIESTAIVLKTIAEVFGSCRAFRDSPPLAEDNPADLVNLVIFCARAETAWTFRKPIEADFLRSQSRRQNLPPKFEVPWDDLLPQQQVESIKVLREGDEHVLRKHSQRTALEHWKIMRQVLPDAVWVNW